MKDIKDQKSKIKDTDKLAELEEDLKRIQAEFMNYRRRQEDERGQILALAKQDVVMQILPILDNIGRALSHLPEDLKDHPWAKGVEQVSKQAEDVLSTLGVQRFQSLGEPFDHNLHEAIAYDESKVNHSTGSGQEGQMSNVETVVEELQPGYKMGDKVIRHAMVRVGRLES